MFSSCINCQTLTLGSRPYSSPRKKNTVVVPRGKMALSWFPSKTNLSSDSDCPATDFVLSFTSHIGPEEFAARFYLCSNGFFVVVFSFPRLRYDFISSNLTGRSSHQIVSVYIWSILSK